MNRNFILEKPYDSQYDECYHPIQQGYIKKKPRSGLGFSCVKETQKSILESHHPGKTHEVTYKEKQLIQAYLFGRKAGFHKKNTN
jgi:hypothetical protein